MKTSGLGSLALVNLLLLLFSAGCGGPRAIQPAADSNRAIAFGHVSVNAYFSEILFAKVGEVYVGPFKEPPRAHVYENGNFFIENLAAGDYYFMAFRVGPQWIYMTYEDEAALRESSFSIPAGGVIYLGSFRIGEEESSVFTADQFSIGVIPEPRPGVILDHLITATQATGWDERLRQAKPGFE